MTFSGVGPQLAAPRRGGSATDPRTREQARVSLLQKIKLSDDWRAHGLDFERLLAGTVFREPHPATIAADLDVITLCSRSRP